jgi:hypothetical protein
MEAHTIITKQKEKLQRIFFEFSMNSPIGYILTLVKKTKFVLLIPLKPSRIAALNILHRKVSFVSYGFRQFYLINC